MYVTDRNTHAEKIRSFALSTSIDPNSGTWATVFVHRGEAYCKPHNSVSVSSVLRVQRAMLALLQGGRK